MRFKAITKEMPAIASDVNVIDVPATVKVIPLPNPSPLTRITAATIRLRDFVKSTLFSTTLRTPIAEIIRIQHEADTTDDRCRK